MPGLVCSFDKHPRTRVTIDCQADDKPCSHNGTKCCRACYDQARRDEDAAWKTDCAACDACPDCQRVRRADYEFAQRRDTLDPSRPYGEHIPLLCRNHFGYEDQPTWHTKNISAGRSIFHGRGAECSCPGHLLFSPGRFLYKLFHLLGTDNCRPYGTPLND